MSLDQMENKNVNGESCFRADVKHLKAVCKRWTKHDLHKEMRPLMNADLSSFKQSPNRHTHTHKHTHAQTHIHKHTHRRTRQAQASVVNGKLWNHPKSRSYRIVHYCFHWWT